MVLSSPYKFTRKPERRKRNYIPNLQHTLLSGGNSYYWWGAHLVQMFIYFKKSSILKFQNPEFTQLRSKYTRIHINFFPSQRVFNSRDIAQVGVWFLKISTWTRKKLFFSNPSFYVWCWTSVQHIMVVCMTFILTMLLFWLGLGLSLSLSSFFSPLAGCFV